MGTLHTCLLAMSPPLPQILLHSSRVRGSRTPGASIAAALSSLLWFAAEGSNPR